MTPAAAAYLGQIRERRQQMLNGAHEDDANTFSRLAYQAKVDSLDLILEELPDVLDAIEQQAWKGQFEPVAADSSLGGS